MLLVPWFAVEALPGVAVLLWIACPGDGASSVLAEPDRPLAPPPAEALEEGTGAASEPPAPPPETEIADPGTGAAAEPGAPPAGQGGRSLADIVEDVGRAVVKVRGWRPARAGGQVAGS